MVNCTDALCSLYLHINVSWEFYLVLHHPTMFFPCSWIFHFGKFLNPNSYGSYLSVFSQGHFLGGKFGKKYRFLNNLLGSRSHICVAFCFSALDENPLFLLICLLTCEKQCGSKNTHFICCNLLKCLDDTKFTKIEILPYIPCKITPPQNQSTRLFSLVDVSIIKTMERNIKVQDFTRNAIENLLQNF